MTHEIPLHAGQITALDFSPNGSTFASGGADGTTIIWNAAEGRQLFVLRGHEGQVTSLAWNPNGSQVAAGCSDGTVKLWEVPAPHNPVTFQSSSNAIQSLTWSKDNRLLTSLSENNLVLSNPATGEVVKTSLATKTREVMSPNSQLLASVSGNEGAYKILVEDVDRHETVCELAFSGTSLRSILWSPNSKRLCVLGKLQGDVWEILGAQRLFTWQAQAIQAGAWAFDNNRLAIAGGGDLTDNGTQQHMGHLHVFDVERKVRLFKVRLGSMRSVATAVTWHPNGESFAGGHASGQVGVWDAANGRPLSITQMHVAGVRGLDWSPDGLRIASVSTDGKLKGWEPSTGDELFSLTDGTQSMTAVKWSSDGTRITGGDNQGQVQVWDASAGYALVSSSDQHRSLARVHKNRAQQSVDREDWPTALAEISLAIESAPSRASYRRSRAIIFVRQGRLNDAMADLSAALDLEPDDIYVLRMRLGLYAELGRWTEALGDASRLVELRQDTFQRFQQAIIHLKLGQVDDYRDICQRLFVGEPDELIYGAQIRGWTCALFPEAVTDFERMLPIMREEMSRGSDPALGSLGAVLYRAGHTKEAVDSLIDASSVWDQSGSIVLPGSDYDLLPGYTWYFLAMACHDLGRYGESQAWYEKAESYTQKALARPAESDLLNSSNYLRQHSVNWHQRVVLELLQREARQVMGIVKPISQDSPN